MKRIDSFPVILLSALCWTAIPAAGQNEAEKATGERANARRRWTEEEETRALEEWKKQAQEQADRNREEREEKRVRRRMIDGYGYPEAPIVPLSHLPEHIDYPGNEVSLIADPKERGGGKIAVYLINATDKPLKDGFDWSHDVMQEVRGGGGHWKRSPRFTRGGCATGKPAASNLGPGHVRVFPAPDPAHGDMEGEIRYCLVRFGHPSIVSAGIRGRFSSEAYRAAGIDRLSYIGVSTTINSSFHYDNRNEPGQEPAWSIEELVAGVEMDWWYDASWRTRHVVKSWLENEQQHLRPQGEAARILYAMLEAPWDRVRDERACFRRALEALSRERGGNFPYGSPERCRAMVWWYLNRRPIGRDDYYFAVNPERWAALEALEATGNPWGARPEELTRLAELAREAVEAGGEREREEAGKVLMQPWIPR